MRSTIFGASLLGGALACAAGTASAIEPDAQFSQFPDRGASIVAGILDGTFDFGEAVLFGSGGLYGPEGLFEDYLRDFLLGPTGKEGVLAEHGFGGAMIGGYGVAANALAPHGYLTSTALWAVGGDPHEVTSNHTLGPLSPSGGPLEPLLHDPAHAAHHQDPHSGQAAAASADFSPAPMPVSSAGLGGIPQAPMAGTTSTVAPAGTPAGAPGAGIPAGAGLLGGLVL